MALKVQFDDVKGTAVVGVPTDELYGDLSTVLVLLGDGASRRDAQLASPGKSLGTNKQFTFPAPVKTTDGFVCKHFMLAPWTRAQPNFVATFDLRNAPMSQEMLVKCAFRRSRPPVPEEGDHLFRLIATTHSGGSRPGRGRL